MTALTTIYGWWVSHGTRIIAFITGTIAAVAGVSGIIPEAHLKYYMAAIAVLTFWRGQVNSKDTP